MVEGLNKGNDGVGVPQGAPTSPLLATLVLRETLFHKDNFFETVMYADDGLVYGDDVLDTDLKALSAQD